MYRIWGFSAIMFLAVLASEAQDMKIEIKQLRSGFAESLPAITDEAGASVVPYRVFPRDPGYKFLVIEPTLDITWDKKSSFNFTQQECWLHGPMDESDSLNKDKLEPVGYLSQLGFFSVHANPYVYRPEEGATSDMTLQSLVFVVPTATTTATVTIMGHEERVTPKAYAFDFRPEKVATLTAEVKETDLKDVSKPLKNAGVSLKRVPQPLNGRFCQIDVKFKAKDRDFTVNDNQFALLVDDIVLPCIGLIHWGNPDKLRINTGFELAPQLKRTTEVTVWLVFDVPKDATTAKLLWFHAPVADLTIAQQ